ncbi:DgyrCDS13138 [Dimorphilus gyrociliatus]|uniref:D-2-hydroxyglutarate dehydrogenase, mitochondrial n=1 Tax=Dimorphilus gyrociliatus TaxID=2664684 RepID=A0A7I8W9R7_9ANNE|nr:DgyrCDS13138 [Dimorphilus gyrociliatus]
MKLLFGGKEVRWALWALRERLAEACKQDGYTYKFDVSIPVAKFSEVTESVTELMKGYPVLYCMGYGHVGDGNLHLNIVSKKFEKDVKSALEIFVFESVAQLNGSVSAEHGLGFHKNECIRYSKGTSAVKLMKRIKALFDPNCVLNPYKTLSSSVISGV